MEIPDGLLELVVAREGEVGRAWAASLPALVDEMCRDWELSVDGEPIGGGTYAVIVPVRQGADAAILKLAWPHAVNAEELMGLRAWNGNGTVRLLESAPERSTLLLERLDASRPLSSEPLAERARVAGALIRQLAIPAPKGIPVLADRAATIVEGLQRVWERTGRPFPEPLLRRTLGIVAEIGPRAARVMANWDLHPGNVLAGRRQPWLAIDPMAIAGDPEVAIWPTVLRCVDELGGPAELRAFVDTIVDAGGLDRDLAWAWLRVRAVDYWLWGLDRGFTEDPVRCARIVAWLDT